MKKNKEYALYKGDKYIYGGTIKEIATKMGVSETTIRFYYSQCYKRRRQESNDCLMLYKIEEEKNNE